METKLIMACVNLIFGLWVAEKMPLSTHSGSIDGSMNNFKANGLDSSLKFNKIAGDTLKKANTKHAKSAPQRSKWGISRKGESITDLK